MVTSRGGHSLAELLVALTLLSASLGGAASAALLGSRSALEAVMRQHALSLATMALDSLAHMPEAPAAEGSLQPEPGWVVAWEAEPVAGVDAAGLRVMVTSVAVPRPLAELHGIWVAPLPGPLPGPLP